MVIVGKQRRGVVEHWFFGCEAERIARYAPCPVLFVGQEITDFSLTRELTH